MKDNLQGRSARTHAEKTLMLFIESGVVYSIFWVGPTLVSNTIIVTQNKSFLVGGTIANFAAPQHQGYTSIPTQRYLAAIITLKSSCLIDLIVRYNPTFHLACIVSFGLYGLGNLSDTRDRLGFTGDIHRTDACVQYLYAF